MTFFFWTPPLKKARLRMAATFEDPDELIPCPMDPVHMVARKRMPYHIMKCQRVGKPHRNYDETPACPPWSVQFVAILFAGVGYGLWFRQVCPSKSLSKDGIYFGFCTIAFPCPHTVCKPLLIVCLSIRAFSCVFYLLFAEF